VLTNVRLTVRLMVIYDGFSFTCLFQVTELPSPSECYVISILAHLDFDRHDWLVEESVLLRSRSSSVVS
jgi:hypothetical protein